MTNNNIMMKTKNLCKAEKHRTNPRAVLISYHGKAFPMRTVCLKRTKEIASCIKSIRKKKYWNNSNKIFRRSMRTKMNRNQTQQKTMNSI